MTKTILAHFTDTHLGQRLAAKSTVEGDKMGYEETLGAHEQHFVTVLDDIAGRGISKLVFGGDIGTAKSVAGFFEILRGHGFEASLVLGNHDTYRNVAKYYDMGKTAVDGKLCFSQDDPFQKRIFLDTSDNVLGAVQRDWLAGELDRARKAAIFLHHPVLPLDTPLDRTGAALKDRDEVRSLLLDADCEVTLFCGHYHMTDEARQANIRQYVTPAVSYQIVKQSERPQADTGIFGYRIIEMDEEGIRTSVVSFASQ